MSLKPLIKVSNLQADAYLPNTPTYTPSEASKIKKYIPKFLTFVGVDSYGNPEQQRQQLQKQKLKVKGVSGKDNTSNTELKFIKENEINIKIWNDVAVCLNMPFNNRQSPEDEKQQLDSKIQFFIENQLYFVDKTGEQITKTSNQLVSLDDVNIFSHPVELNAQNFDNSYRQIRFSLAIGAILHKKQAYSVKQLEEAIKSDLLNSLKIMIKNKLPIRILKSSFTKERVLVLQSFVSKFDDIESQSKKLAELLNKPLANLIKQQQKVIEYDREAQNIEGIPRKQLSNRQLMLILLGLFFIYLFLKINPLEKILADPL